MRIFPHQDTPPIVWTIAGSDPCGGAGLQADIKTLTILGAHACAIVSALTAQNSVGVSGTETVSAAMLKAQIEALRSDMPARAIKIGMLGDAESIRVLAHCLAPLDVYTICDPVLVSSSGTPLIAEDAIAKMKEFLFPRVNLLTPNKAEAEALTRRALLSDVDVEAAAQDLLSFGVKAVLIKGWDSGQGFSQDFYTNATDKFWLTSPKRAGVTSRGTGCAFSSVLAAAHAFGYSEADASVIAKIYINQGLRYSRRIGKGMPLLAHDMPACLPQDMPWSTRTAPQGRTRMVFPDCGTEALGFYPIVDSAVWLERLLPLGIKTAQLRIKSLTGAALENEIKKSISLACHHNCRLFINDYWELALAHNAYGVHLGQEDIETADIDALARSGMRLGLSTHCYAEIARARALNPSYLAIGPVFPTTLKAMKFAPLGVPVFQHWRALLDTPVVAIGGITLERAPSLIAAGASSIAVVSDVTQNNAPEKRAQDWLKLSFPS